MGVFIHYLVCVWVHACVCVVCVCVCVVCGVCVCVEGWRSEWGWCSGMFVIMLLLLILC